MRKTEGPDFDVYYFSDGATKSSMGLYAGYNPGLRTECTTNRVDRRSGQIGPSKVEWLHWTDKGLNRSETLVHDMYGEDKSRRHGGLIIHLFMSAPTEKEIERMEQAASTLRLERR